jgi:hypothetical protein
VNAPEGIATRKAASRKSISELLVKEALVCGMVRNALENISVSPLRQYRYFTSIADPVGIFASTNTAIPFDAVDCGNSTTRETYFDVGVLLVAYMVTLAANSAEISITGDTDVFAPLFREYCRSGLLEIIVFKYTDSLFKKFSSRTVRTRVQLLGTISGA